VDERRVAVFLSSAGPGALRLAASCALTAASLGGRVDVFLVGPAVREWAEGLEERDADPADPVAQLSRARASGVRIVACSASVVEEKVELGTAERALDAVVGWPTILEWTRGVTERFFF
jgi:predicted peroxiredoxin